MNISNLSKDPRHCTQYKQRDHSHLSFLKNYKPTHLFCNVCEMISLFQNRKAVT